MPMRLEDDWNFLQLNMADLTRKAYGVTTCMVMMRQIHTERHTQGHSTQKPCGCRCMLHAIYDACFSVSHRFERKSCPLNSDSTCHNDGCC